MTLTMTLIYVFLAFAAGAGLAYAWQALRIRQVEREAAATLKAVRTDLSFCESWRETYHKQAEALARELRDIKERRASAGTRAAQTKKRRDEKRALGWTEEQILAEERDGFVIVDALISAPTRDD